MTVKPTRRVLVVDDATIYRHAISQILSSESEIEVVGTAANGRLALEKIPELRPDIVTLDMEMPEMDGLETLHHLHALYPEIQTIVVSHYTEEGAELTIRALQLGAVDFVTKPGKNCSLAENLQFLREQLLPKIRQLKINPQRRVATAHAPSRTIKWLVEKPQKKKRELIAIGASTGGPRHLSELFGQFSPGMRQTILIVQHMPPLFTEKLAYQLNQVGTVPAKEAEDGEIITAGRAYIAPGDFHMKVVEKEGTRRIQLTREPPENFCRPAVDVLFRSVATVYGQQAVGVVMTGMGRDGLKGCEVLKAGGAPVVVQDEATSVVWGMPGHVVRHGLADAIAPIDRLYEAIRMFIA